MSTMPNVRFEWWCLLTVHPEWHYTPILGFQSQTLLLLPGKLLLLRLKGQEHWSGTLILRIGALREVTTAKFSGGRLTKKPNPKKSRQSICCTNISRHPTTILVLGCGTSLSKCMKFRRIRLCSWCQIFC